LLDALMERVREALQADTAAILLLDRRSGQLVATAASGLEEEVQQGVRIPVGRGFAGRIAAQGSPVILNEIDHTKVINPILLEKGIRSLLGAPVRWRPEDDRYLALLRIRLVGSPWRPQPPAWRSPAWQWQVR
jgi:sigma-B regulation protein RsbU (phosphoserine phosphatase)